MAENENDWDLGAIVRSCSKMNNSVRAIVDHGVHEDDNSALVDNSVHGDGNSVNTSLFQEERNSVGDFREAFAVEKKRYFGLDEVISLANNLNTNSRIENRTETISNTPLVNVEHEEEKKKKKKKARYSMQSSTTESGNLFIYRGKIHERHEILAEELSKVDQWRWKKHGSNQTGRKNYYTCNEVDDCPAKRHIEQSSKDPTKVIVTYRGQHNHPPPQQNIPVVHRRPNAAAPRENPSSYSSTSTLSKFVVIGAIQGEQVPKTQEKIEQYLSYSKPKSTKLVQNWLM
ncbi:probable WRKY transcription factor 4 [Solanum pennellii]|uniref:Probable WRKY transcription factor 4 n=1 Tax=Solanum pennellii TaxID=28526 RepID=A0ABM1GBT6_SOLPN|nr:probable WRKY transcription factor 4 [Solanum pennellii]